MSQMMHPIFRYSFNLIAVTWAGLQAASVQAQTRLDEPPAAETVRPGANRLFFAPTGRTLPASVSEVGAYQVLAPYFTRAFHDRFMMAVGTPLLPNAFVRFWYLAPKVGLEISPLLNVAAGALVILDVGGEPYSGSNVVESFFWGVASFGSPQAALTFGLASDVGQLSVLPDGGLLILGGELELPVRSRDEDDVSLRLIAESYMGLPSSEISVTDVSLHLIGLRFTAGGRRWRSLRASRSRTVPSSSGRRCL
jgi:hypothetical protein